MIILCGLVFWYLCLWCVCLYGECDGLFDVEFSGWLLVCNSKG